MLDWCIMFLDLKSLRRSGKDTQSFFYEYSPEKDLIDIPNTKLDLPVKISGEVTLTGMHSAFISGEIAFTLTGECTRCLSSVTREYVAEFDEQVEENNPDGYSVVNDTVDLGKIVEDAILINLPVSFLCKEDCKGICLNCGVNLNEDSCKCKN